MTEAGARWELREDCLYLFSSGLKPTTRMGFVASEANLIKCVSGRRFAQQAMQFV
jgi:hypothetical protein